MRRPKVLIVDDKPANHLALAAVLEHDHELRFANSGGEAIDMLARSPDADVILMDVQMPDMDGFECALRIKKLERIRDIPIIFITAVYQDDPFVKRGYEVGGIDYFSKPFDPEILRMKIGAYAGFRLREELARERELHVRESEEVLRASRKLSALLESLPVGVLVADVEGRICQITEAAQRILKADPADAEAYGGLLRSGETTHSEPVAIRCLDGSTKTILASVSPLRGLDGRRLGAVVLIRDLTEAKQIEEDLARRVTRLIGLGVELEQSAARPL